MIFSSGGCTTLRSALTVGSLFLGTLLGCGNDRDVSVAPASPARVAFSAASSSTSEGADTQITVVLSMPEGGLLPAPLTVDIRGTANGTATSGTDYPNLSTTLVFPAESSDGAMLSVTLSPISDGRVEGDESVELILEKPGADGLLGDTTMHTVQIVDAETATVAFASASSATTEDGTNHGVDVQLVLSPTTATLAVPITVDVIDAANGAATSGSDYGTLGTQSLTFAVGAGDGAAQTAAVKPTDDANVEDSETVVLLAQNVGGPAVLGAQLSHEITITDNDTATFAFELPSSATDDESTPHGVDIILGIAGGGSLETSVSADIVDALTGSATSGSDYTTFSLATVTFTSGAADGSTSSVTVAPLGDSALEGAETIELTLQSVTGPAIPEAQTSHQVTLTDAQVNQPPVVGDDSYETIGNTRLHATVGTASAPIKHPTNVLVNDSDANPEHSSLDCTPIVAGATSLGGTVDLAANGDFIYAPPAGVTGLTDSFTYAVNDPWGATDTGTVTIDIVDLVWFVDNTAAPGGDGRDHARFDSLSDIPADSDGSTVYVFEGSGDTAGGLTLADDQRVLGGGVALEFDVNNTLTDPDGSSPDFCVIGDRGVAPLVG